MAAFEKIKKTRTIDFIEAAPWHSERTIVFARQVLLKRAGLGLCTSCWRELEHRVPNSLSKTKKISATVNGSRRAVSRRGEAGPSLGTDVRSVRWRRLSSTAALARVAIDPRQWVPGAPQSRAGLPLPGPSAWTALGASGRERFRRRRPWPSRVAPRSGTLRELDEDTHAAFAQQQILAQGVHLSVGVRFCCCC